MVLPVGAQLLNGLSMWQGALHQLNREGAGSSKSLPDETLFVSEDNQNHSHETYSFKHPLKMQVFTGVLLF